MGRDLLLTARVSRSAFIQLQVRGYAINRKRNVKPARRRNQSSRDDYYCKVEQELKYYKLRRDDKIPIKSQERVEKEIDVPYHVSSISKLFTL